MLRKFSGAFAGGALGSLVDSVNIWILSHIGITAMLGIGLKPKFTPAWLYPRLVWGGIWAFLLILPFLKGRTIIRGMVFSLAPSAMMLFVVFPDMGKGMYGLKFGALTPLLVVLLNFIYGIVASLWYKHSSS